MLQPMLLLQQRALLAQVSLQAAPSWMQHLTVLVPATTGTVHRKIQDTDNVLALLSELSKLYLVLQQQHSFTGVLVAVSLSCA